MSADLLARTKRRRLALAVVAARARGDERVALRILDEAATVGVLQPPNATAMSLPGTLSSVARGPLMVLGWWWFLWVFCSGSSYGLPTSLPLGPLRKDSSFECTRALV